MKKERIKKVLCAILASVILMSFSACTIESGPAKENYEADSTSSASKKSETFSLNETAVFNTLKITATEVKESGGQSFLEPESGNTFVGVKFTIENISDEDQTVSSILLFDAYADDVSCDFSISAAVAFNNQMLDGTIAPGKKVIGWYTVEIPENWETLELNVRAEWLSNTSATFVFNS